MIYAIPKRSLVRKELKCLLLDPVFPHSSHKSRAGEGLAPSKPHAFIPAGTNRLLTAPSAGLCSHVLSCSREDAACLQLQGQLLTTAEQTSNSHGRALQEDLPLRDGAPTRTGLKPKTECYCPIKLALPFHQTHPTDQGHPVSKKPAVHDSGEPPLVPAACEQNEEQSISQGEALTEAVWAAQTKPESDAQHQQCGHTSSAPRIWRCPNSLTVNDPPPAASP